jgi:endonuclease YncB( thermonuclease family)
MEMVRPVLASISDPALRAALQEAHAERLGIWVAVWPVTLLVLSQILETKIQE